MTSADDLRALDSIEADLSSALRTAKRLVNDLNSGLDMAFRQKLVTDIRAVLDEL